MAQVARSSNIKLALRSPRRRRTARHERVRERDAANWSRTDVRVDDIREFIREFNGELGQVTKLAASRNLCPTAKLRRIPRLCLPKRSRRGQRSASPPLRTTVFRVNYRRLCDVEPPIINGGLFFPSPPPTTKYIPVN